MRFSVIIPAYNEEEVIRKALSGLKGQTFKDFEIIVVYGGNDSTPEIARKYTKKVYKEPKGTRGPAKARNFGAKKAQGDIVVFLDADTWPNPEWLSAYNTCFSKGVVGAGGPVFADTKNHYLRFVYWLNQNILYRITALFGFYQFSGNNCAYKRDVFLKAGGFNEKTSMLEDTELSLRMKRFGKEIFCPDAWVKTSPRRIAEDGFWRVFFKNMVGYWGLYTKGFSAVRYFKEWKKDKGKHKK